MALAEQVTGPCHLPWSKMMFRDDSSSELAKPFSFRIKAVVICFGGLAHINLFRSLHELTMNSPWEGYEERRREEAIGKRKAELHVHKRIATPSYVWSSSSFPTK